MDELFAAVADGKSKHQGLPGLFRMHLWWSCLAQECRAQPEGSDGTLGSGLVTTLSSTVLLLSPGRSVTLGSIQIPRRPCWHVVPRPFCAGPWTMYGVCLVLTWLQRTKTTRSQYSRLRRASLLSTGHICSFPSESQRDFPAACPRRVLLITRNKYLASCLPWDCQESSEDVALSVYYCVHFCYFSEDV